MTEIPGMADPAVAQLIARLQKASGSDRGELRELDRQIDLLLHPGAWIWSPEWYSGGRNEYIRWPDPKPGVAEYRQVHHYTISIDYALTLVPEGWRDDVDLELSLGEFGKQLGGKSCFACLATGHIQTPSTKQVTAHAHTPAIALCIAALKARLSNVEASR